MKPTGRNTGTARFAVASSASVPGAADRDRVCIGAVAGAHGLAGAVRIKSFTEDPADLDAYGPVFDDAGVRQFKIRVQEVRRNVVIAGLSGVLDRAEAEALKGLRLYVPRAALPPPDEDEYYHADLLGLAATGEEGQQMGVVVSIIPVGEAEVLEIDPGPGQESLMLPFTAETVSEVDLNGGRIVVVAPSHGDRRSDKDR